MLSSSLRFLNNFNDFSLYYLGNEYRCNSLILSVLSPIIDAQIKENSSNRKFILPAIAGDI